MALPPTRKFASRWCQGYQTQLDERQSQLNRAKLTPRLAHNRHNSCLFRGSLRLARLLPPTGWRPWPRKPPSRPVLRRGGGDSSKGARSPTNDNVPAGGLGRSWSRV